MRLVDGEENPVPRGVAPQDGDAAELGQSHDGPAGAIDDRDVGGGARLADEDFALVGVEADGRAVNRQRDDRLGDAGRPSASGVAGLDVAGAHADGRTRRVVGVALGNAAREDERDQRKGPLGLQHPPSQGTASISRIIASS